MNTSREEHLKLQAAMFNMANEVEIQDAKLSILEATKRFAVSHGDVLPLDALNRVNAAVQESDIAEIVGTLKPYATHLPLRATWVFSELVEACHFYNDATRMGWPYRPVLVRSYSLKWALEHAKKVKLSSVVTLN